MTRLCGLQLLPVMDIRRLIPLVNPFKGSENTALQNLPKLATSRLCRKPVSLKKKKDLFLLVLKSNISVEDQVDPAG